MIAGIGTDIIEVDRIRQLAEQGPDYLSGVFSSGEISYCTSKRYPHQHYAARFAAKEAFLKALGTGWRHGIRFADIEIVSDELGKPSIRLGGKAREVLEKKVSSLYDLHVSMAHLKQFATATVIIETRE